MLYAIVLAFQNRTLLCTINFNSCQPWHSSSCTEVSLINGHDRFKWLWRHVEGRLFSLLGPSAPITTVMYTYECTNTLLIATSVHVEARRKWPELKSIVTSNIRFGNAKTIAYSVINTPNKELSDSNDKDSWAKIYLNLDRQKWQQQDEMPVLATWFYPSFDEKVNSF